MINKFRCNQICNYEYETLDGEVIIYLLDYDKIIVLNETATFIWNHIVDNSDDILSVDHISKMLCDAFQVSSIDISEVVEDIKEILNEFISEKMITIEEES